MKARLFVALCLACGVTAEIEPVFNGGDRLPARPGPRPHRGSSLGALAAATGFGGGLMLAVTAIVHFAVTQPATDRRIAELELREGTAEQQAASAQQKIELQQKQIAALEKSKAALEDQLAANRNCTAPAPAPTTTVKGHPPPHPNTPKTDPKGPVGDPHDPMGF